MSKPKVNFPSRSVADLGIQDLSVGMIRVLNWVAVSSELDAFAALSGDINPLHVDPEFARRCGFPDRVAHGFLLGAKISAFVGTVMPGRDCLLLETQLAWPAPIFAGDLVQLSGEIVDLSEEHRVMRIKFRATVERDGASVSVGRGWALCQIRS